MSGADKFAGVAWTPGPRSGAPLLEGTLGWLECEVADVYEAGDHWLVTARVLDLSAQADRQPLTFFRGALAGLGAHHRPEHERT